MKKNIFLDKLEEKINNMDYPTLKRSSLKMAKYISNYSYEDVLSILDKATIIKQDVENSTDYLLDTVKKLCTDIEEGVYNVNWGYSSEEWGEDDLYDEDGVSEKIESILLMCEKYVRSGKFKDAYLAYEMIYNVKILSEYDEPTEITELFNYNLISLDLNVSCKYYAYSSLMSLKENERIEKLFEIEEYVNYNLLISDIIALREEAIPQKEEFLTKWIAFLKTKEPELSENLLIDSIKYYGGTNALDKFVLSDGTKYKKSYVELLKIYMNEKNYDKAVKIAYDSFGKISGQNPYLKSISDLLLEIGELLNNKDLIRKGKIEGFNSSLVLESFLNLYSLNDSDIILNSVKLLDSSKTNSDYYFIHFFNKDYEISSKGLKKSFSRYDDSSVKLLLLFTILLSEKSSISPCTLKLTKEKFKSLNFEFENFKKILLNNVTNLKEDEYDNYFNLCLNTIDEYVENIVGGQIRDFYELASSLIFSMAETIKSKKGNEQAKDYIVAYKKKYPRHSAFHKYIKEDMELGCFAI